MFHTATVRPTRSGPNILYNTSLIKLHQLKNLQWSFSEKEKLQWIFSEKKNNLEKKNC